MTLPIGENEIEIQDFTIKRTRKRFRIDVDIFECRAILGIPQLQRLVNLTRNISKVVDAGNFDAICKVFDEILLPDSAAILRERIFSDDDTRVIDVREQLIPILQYVLEAYGVGRPTQPSLDSSNG